MPDTRDPADDRDAPDLDEVADTLYALRPDEFIAGREDAVARAREAGDRDLAKAIGKLRRPTKAAWLANLLARHRGEQLAGLLGLAADLAQAQRTLDGEQLRALTTQRHKLVRAMAREAASLARAAHEPAAEPLLRELQGILEAALADPEIAREVRSGRLTRTVTYSGFGPRSDPDATPTPQPLRAVPDPAPAPEPGADADRDGDPGPGDADAEAERERAERERRERERAERAEALDAAQAEEDAARDRRRADEDARDAAVSARDAAHERVTELAAELEAARAEERSATATARDADAAARTSARAAEAAATRAARARARLDEL